MENNKLKYDMFFKTFKKYYLTHSNKTIIKLANNIDKMKCNDHWHEYWFCILVGWHACVYNFRIIRNRHMTKKSYTTCSWNSRRFRYKQVMVEMITRSSIGKSNGTRNSHYYRHLERQYPMWCIRVELLKLTLKIYIGNYRYKWHSWTITIMQPSMVKPRPSPHHR
jgi:hypothetical protein